MYSLYRTLPTCLALGVIAAASFVVTTAVAAQTPGELSKLSLDDLRPPLSPAFVVLGIEPASVQRPETPKAVSSALLALVTDKGGIPRNYALEVAPYWLKSRPAFQFNDFYSPRFGLTVRRSLAFSLATTPRVLSGDTLGTSIGLGTRALLSGGRASESLTRIKNELVSELGKCAAEEAPDKIAECYDKLKPLRDSLKANQEPVGLLLQVAAAGSAEFPNDIAEGGRWRRVGIWVTPSYRSEGRIEAILVARYLHQRIDPGESGHESLFDVGGRLLWRPASVFAVSAEALSRIARGGNAKEQETPRYGALLEYRAAQSFYVFYSFGKDFAAANVPKSRLISTLGINVGFGQTPLVTVQ